ncbi:uncharacterized protein ATNIH1004_008848 [Aspergillus tanneri]|uniref:ABC transmembrane type-1 domain-containing protein n=1 Tax=Aspergillus tanneri TaxID=1220188 RepID=A0A5M9MC95_9EURO|nr:uncharacterized protein ATNIH1004_008848 [Aspergillus tanneri]KAA8644642.1 hypothetical protein ATNIH1004_008848 [Aspergillus tanneri]
MAESNVNDKKVAARNSILNSPESALEPPVIGQRPGCPHERQVVKEYSAGLWNPRTGDPRTGDPLSPILLIIQSTIGADLIALSIVATLFIFITFAVTNHALDAAIIFSFLTLFNSLRTPLNWLPVAIGQVINALASVRRIKEFLIAEEHEEQAPWDFNMFPAVEIRNAIFTWEQGMGTKEKSGASVSPLASQSVFQLHDLDLTVPCNELLEVLGNVGAGKTLLLARWPGRCTAGTV